MQQCLSENTDKNGDGDIAVLALNFLNSNAIVSAEYAKEYSKRG